MIYIMFKSGHWTEKSEKRRWTLCDPFLVHRTFLSFVYASTVGTLYRPMAWVGK